MPKPDRLSNGAYHFSVGDDSDDGSLHTAESVVELDEFASTHNAYEVELDSPHSLPSEIAEENVALATEDALEDANEITDASAALLGEGIEDEYVAGYSMPKTNPEWTANIFSLLSFWWLNDLFKRGYRTPLEEEDLYPMGPSDRARASGERLANAWRMEEARGRSSLAWAMNRAFGLYFWLSALWKIVYDVLQFASPALIGYMVVFIQDEDAPIGRGLLISFLLFLVPLIQTVCINQYFQRCYRAGMQVRAGIMVVIYGKSLRLSTSSRQDATVGEIVNLMSTDANRLKSLLTYLHGIWSAPLQICLSLFFLTQLLGPAALAGAAVLVLMIPVNSLIARIQTKFQTKFMKAKDERVRAMNETLQGIRVIKFFSWTQSCHEKITDLRAVELAALRMQLYLRALATFLWYATPIMVSVITFMLYVALGNVLSSSIVFPAIALFNVLRFPISMLPRIINDLVTARVSWLRIEEFLKLDELQSLTEAQQDFESETNSLDSSALNSIHQDNSLPLGSVVVDEASFSWDDTNFAGDATLRKVSLQVKPGQLVMVVGEVGSGKSSLLSAILGEMTSLEGSVSMHGRVSYVPQQAWMKNATLRDNITFGRPLNENDYRRVIRVCALEPDIEMLPAGDRTEIGEKGINLSGGQKQRVSIARATYQDADIYLFDDPLSAVDIHVAKHIFDRCVQRRLAGKTRILATHQLFCLKDADLIVCLRNGAIAEVGTYDELVQDGLDFAALMEVHNADEDRSDENELTLSASGDLKRSLSASDEGSETFGASHEKNKTDQANEGAKLVQAEERDTGQVKLAVYRAYIDAAGWHSVILTVIMMVIYQALNYTSSWWLSYWGDHVSPSGSDSSSSLMLDESMQGSGLMDEMDSDDSTKGNAYYEMVYVLLSFGSALASLFGSFLVYIGGLRASRLLHAVTLESVLAAPIQFFDTTPVGRILNRFSRDQDGIDSQLPSTLASALRCFISVASVVILMCVAAPFFIIVVIPISALYYFIQAYYLRTSRELKRLDSITNSPIYSHFSETLNGVTTIRAYSACDRFMSENEERLDKNQRCFWPSMCVNRWLSQRLDVVGSVIILLASIFAVVFRGSSNSNLVGLALTYAISLSGTLNWMVRMSTETETQMNSVERMRHYHAIERELPDFKHHEDGLLPVDWPADGTIRFEHVTMRYRPELPPVLQDVSFSVNPCEKIGICGRTGAGKSSLMMALFRLVELSAGQIFVDGVDIGTIGLHRLRTSFSVIPQDPMMFKGTLRRNLNPFDDYTDAALWRALERVHLHHLVKSLTGGLDAEVSENGENFSVGERQLFCMARALLKDSKIIVMDEATAAVDVETDRIIQETIREECKNATVLTIAHRLNTIIDYDRILLLDAGKLIEYGTPAELLADPNSAFAVMVSEAGGMNGSPSPTLEEQEEEKSI